jgi:hypothetical protein
MCHHCSERAASVVRDDVDYEPEDAVSVLQLHSRRKRLDDRGLSPPTGPQQLGGAIVVGL